MASPEPREETREGLLVDWGGVLTSSLLDSFAAFCTGEGLAADAVIATFRANPEARRLVAELETGALSERRFEQRFAALLGVSPERLIDRLLAHALPDRAMLAAVGRARRAGIRTCLLANSWGTGRYDRAALHECFDALVISGEIGLRKPAPEIYERAAHLIGLPPERCVFVDDLPLNLAPAAELGMAAVHHLDAARTIPALERLLGVALS